MIRLKHGAEFPEARFSRAIRSNAIFHSWITFFLLFFSLVPSSASQLSGMEAEDEAGSERVATYKVGMLGASEVGKTALIAQFTTSDYICAYDASLGKHVTASTLALPLFDFDVIRHSGRINSITNNRVVSPEVG